MYDANISVIHNTQRPESTLKKKSNSICYHVVGESLATGESIITHIPSVDNCAFSTTKFFSADQKKNNLVLKILYDIVD